MEVASVFLEASKLAIFDCCSSAALCNDSSYQFWSEQKPLVLLEKVILSFFELFMRKMRFFDVYARPSNLDFMEKIVSCSGFRWKDGRERIYSSRCVPVGKLEWELQSGHQVVEGVQTETDLHHWTLLVLQTHLRAHLRSQVVNITLPKMFFLFLN